MKYLIMGCNGMVGHMVSLYLQEQGHDVTGFARKDSGIVKTVIGDATDLVKVKSTIENGNFDYVVNCIGILNKDAEDHKADAVFLNAYLPHCLADITRESQTRIIHISTDCVFSGKRGQYRENDLRDGETFYDRSKALGELEDNKNLTIRTSVVGPDRNENGIGLLNWFMKQEGTINGYSNVVWTGLTTLQLAKVINSINNSNITGLYNVVPGNSISKYELLKLFNAYYRDNCLNIIAYNEKKIDKSLVRDRWHGYIPDYPKMIDELGIWMQKHSKLYTYY